MSPLIGLIILSLAVTVKGRPSQSGHESAVLESRSLFSNGTRGSDVVCRPTEWYDVVLFYFTNYIIHALSVRSLPGESHFSSTAFKFLCLLVPFTGVRRGLSLVQRASNLAPNDLQAAAKAGALCMVVRSKDWRPQNGDVVDACNVERTDGDIAGDENVDTGNGIELCPTSSAEESSIEKSDPFASVSGRNNFDATISVKSPYKALFGIPITAKLAAYTVRLAGPKPDIEVDLITDATAIRIQGHCKLPPGYQLCYVPGDMKVYPRLMLRDTTATHLTGNDYRAITKQTKVTSSHAFPRMFFSLAQTFSGGYQLYKVRGAQISQFGFAAYGFTVIPYVIVSIINFIGCILTNEYTCVYIVHSEIMDEMIDKGGIVDGAVGTIVVPKEIFAEDDSTQGQEYHKVDGKRFLFEASEAALHCRSVGEYPTEDFAIVEPPPESIPRPPFKVRLRQMFHKKKRTKVPTASPTITIPSHTSFTRLPRRNFQVFLDMLCIALLSIAVCAPWLIIGLFSGFHSYNANSTQTNYALMWLVAGQFHAYFGGCDKKIVKKEALRGFFFLFIAYGAPCLGGFIIVAEELVQSGICSDTSLWYLQ